MGPGLAPSLCPAPTAAPSPDFPKGSRIRIALLSASALVLVAGLAGCFSSEPEAVGGMTERTLDALAGPAQETATAFGGDNVYTLDGGSCGGGWAVTNGALGPKDAPADGPQGGPTNSFFQAEGQCWIPKSQEQVCGTFNPDEPDEPDEPDAYPADAEIPELVYPEGCLS